MTVEELDALLATPMAIFRFAAKASKNGYDDAALAVVEFIVANPQAKALAARLLTPVFGCDADDCDCPTELEPYREDLAKLGAVLESGS